MHTSIACFYLISLIKVAFADNLAAPSLVVETTVGTIIGTRKEVNVFGEIKHVENYFGIPYAEPPVGELRFKNAVPKEKLNQPLYATKHGKACFQMDFLPLIEIQRSEDCLFLNIYGPADSHGGLAVMVFIHGGAFVHGASDVYVSNTLAVFGNVIVVTFNYRLSIFGFLSTRDQFAPGNYGLSDQHMAIRWVHENIKSFGGDPDRITLFGESAGGVSVVLQSMYEGNTGLFHRGIAQSGTIVPRPYDFFLANPLEDTQTLGSLVGCKAQGSQPLVDCLRTIPADVLYSTLNNVSNGFFRIPAPFIVNTIDGELIKEVPNIVLKDTSEKYAAQRELFSSRDFIFGFNTNEGCFMVGPAVGVPDKNDFQANRTDYETHLVPLALSLALGPDATDLINHIVLQTYTNWEDPEKIVNIREQFVSLYTDLIFSESIIEASILHEALSNRTSLTYLYEFDVLPSAHPLPSTSWCDRASHGDDLLFLFFEESGGIMTFVPEFEEYEPKDFERNVAKTMMTSWSNFAKSGSPNGPEPFPVRWPKYSTEFKEYLHITRQLTPDSVQSHLIAGRFNLWNKIIPEVLKHTCKTKT